MRRLRKTIMSKSLRLWLAEIAGVIALASAAWMIYQPSAIVVLGVYLVVVGNTQEVDDASDREGNS